MLSGNSKGVIKTIATLPRKGIVVTNFLANCLTADLGCGGGFGGSLAGMLGGGGGETRGGSGSIT